MAPQQSHIDVQHEGDVVIVRFPGGKTDGNAVRELYELAAALSEPGRFKLLVDLSGVDMATSGFMGMLVTVKKRALSCGGQLQVFIADARIMQSFRVMNLHLILLLFDDAARAKHFKG